MSRRRTIGMAAKASGVSPKMIRHYESLGLLPPALRSEGNYRMFSDDDVHTLRFIHRARGLGFSLEDVGRLLDLWRDRTRPSAEVKQLATGQINALSAKVKDMQAMIATLEALAQRCHGDGRPDCPILDELGEHREARGSSLSTSI